MSFLARLLAAMIFTPIYALSGDDYRNARLMKCVGAGPIWVAHAIWMGLIAGSVIWFSGCASVSSEYGTTFAFGQTAYARIYACPDVPVEARRTVELNEPATLDVGVVGSIKQALGGEVKLPRRITKTDEPAAAGACHLVQEAKGSAISEAFGGVLRLVARTAWHALKAVFTAPAP